MPNETNKKRNLDLKLQSNWTNWKTITRKYEEKQKHIDEIYWQVFGLGMHWIWIIDKERNERNEIDE